MMTLPPSIPPTVAAHALAALRCDTPAGTTTRTLVIADMSQKNTAQRLWVLDLRDPRHPVLVLRTQVAHGEGSDPRHTGFAKVFSNVQDSGMTSLGAYHIAERYRGADGSARYRLDGMSSTDYNARTRDVVFHTASYVHDDADDSVGWSQGCVAISHAAMAAIDKREGTMTGAILWVDAPGVPVPTCAPAPVFSIDTGNSTRACFGGGGSGETLFHDASDLDNHACVVS